MEANILKRSIAIAAVLAAWVAAPSPALAQGSLPTPTPEQLEMLRNLPPEQREELLRQLGLGGDDTQQGDRSGNQQGVVQGGVSPDSSRVGDEPVDPRLRRDPILKSEDTIIVSVAFPAVRVEQPAQEGRPPVVIDPTKEWDSVEKAKLAKVIERLLERNPYRLNRNGELLLPGFAAMPLAGLSEEQASLRLMAEPGLQKLVIDVTLLPLEKSGTAALKPFGYDLFKQSPSTFAPITNVPVPADYVIGSGDQLEVQLYGNQNRTLRLKVGPDGNISFPEIGPINVGGQRFSVVKSELEDRVARQMIGVRANVSMGDVRSIRVFVLGEVTRPGTYTVSGLASMTSAIFAAGGVLPIGSLRDVQLKRGGAIVRRLDLYDLLIRGDTRDDAKLLPGDVIFVPPIGPTAAIDGQVRRPAIYELRGPTNAIDGVELAGGLQPDADPRTAYLSRIDDQRRRVVLNVDLENALGRDTLLRNGDVFRIPRLRPTLDSGVTVSGHVYEPGAVAWRNGLRLSQVIRSLDDLQANADTQYVLIRRESGADRRISVLSADLAAALREPGSVSDVVLMPRDQIVVFDLSSGREAVIEPLLRDLKLQSSSARPTESVHISGAVKVSGTYPLEPGMRVSDLIRAGGGLDDSAYGSSAEISRFTIVGEERQTETIVVDLAAALQGDSTANLLLKPYDILVVKEMPEWREQQVVLLEGEVKFPGLYPIARGESLRAAVERAGGLTSYASPPAAIFTRENLREREQAQLDQLVERTRTGLATLALQSAQANQAGASTSLTVGQTLLTQLQATRAVGRLVINLEEALAAKPGTEFDIILEDGDRLIVPKRRQEVTVLGEVQNSTSHFFQPGLTRNDYIDLSGGVTRQADDGQTYVVRADGSVVASGSSGWFSRSSNVTMQPGDTIVVPLDTERLPPLPFWQAVTQIMYNIAISVAAINSF
jgi:protein involved in polysaccharide export with SLBB domain